MATPDQRVAEIAIAEAAARAHTAKQKAGPAHPKKKSNDLLTAAVVVLLLVATLVLSIAFQR